MQTSLKEILSSNTLPKILSLFGQEDFLLEETFNQIISKFLTKEDLEYNYELVNCENVGLYELCDKANSFPMMSEYKFIVVSNIEKIFQGSSKSIKGISNFEKLINNPPSTSRIIFRGLSENLNGFSSSKSKGKAVVAKYPFDIILNQHPFIEFSLVDENKIPEFISQRFALANKKITSSAIELILAQVNPQLREIANEVDKLILYSDNENVITENHVLELVGVSKENNVFELQKSISTRNIQSSLSILENLLSSSGQEMLIISVLTKYYMGLWKFVEVFSPGANLFELSKNISINYGAAKEYANAVKYYNTAKIENALVLLSDIDEKLKTSSDNSKYLMQNLFINILK